VEHRRVPQPFELARTLLVKGEVERRAKQKRAARSTLEQALGLFQDLGAPFWAQRARDDLVRVGGAVPAPSELTPTRRVSPPIPHRLTRPGLRSRVGPDRPSVRTEGGMEWETATAHHSGQV
jgi:hypothetical protein